MQDYLFLYCCVFSLPSLMLLLGLVYVFKKDWAWQYVAWMLGSVKPQRTPAWNRYSTITGVILIIFGLVIITFLVVQLSN